MTVIVTLWPAARVPEVCERLTPPSSWDGTEIDQLTGPPWAVSVNELLPAPAIAMRDLDTLSVPAAGAEAGESDPPEPDPWLPDDPDPKEAELEPEAARVDVDAEALADGEMEPPESGTAELAATGSADGSAVGDGDPAFAREGFAWAGLWLVEVLADDAPACAPWLAAGVAEAASGATAEIPCDDELVLASGRAVKCPCVAHPVAVAATATVPTAATLSGALPRPSRPAASCLGNPSGPNDMRRLPRILCQRASGLCWEVIW